MSRFSLPRTCVCAVVLFLTVPVVIAGPRDGSKYIVVSFAPEGDGFENAAEMLVERHDAHLIRHDPAKLNELLPVLRASKPDYVAFVLKPDQLDINLVQRILRLSTEIDRDPFVDFAYGFVTGPRCKGRG